MANVHKDFHGALKVGLDYLRERYGPAEATAFLERLGRTVYAPLIADLRERGLDALAEHWRRVFDLEEGECELTREDRALVLTVTKCPAVAHMRAKGTPVTRAFCESTRVVNETICREAGYACSLQFGPGPAQCVQRFWKEG